ncbi:MAG: DUF3108 domain-containing protein [Desulfopila sp.]|jgi:hypothetical protein|nr:DUF3108 domain-containing protein [Desulfopila sp.]
MKAIILNALIVVAAIFLITPQEIIALQPQPETDSQQRNLDPEFQPEPGAYAYDVLWRGVRVGKASVSTTVEDDLYTVAVTAETHTKFNFLYKFRYQGEVSLKAPPVRPIEAKMTESGGKKEKTTTITFSEEDKATAVRVKKEPGKEKEVSTVSAESQSFLLDPFSVVFLVRHLDWHVGMAEIFDVFTGRKQYLLMLYCAEVRIKTINDEQREAWVITPTTKEMGKPDAEEKSDFTLYLSKDEKKEILKIEGVPRIGRVEAIMRYFEPDSSGN